MTPELIYTASLILLMTVLLIRETFETELVVFGTLILLTAGGVITIEEAFSGFSNRGMLTIAFLFVLAGAVYNTGAMTHLQNFMFGNRLMSQIKALIRIIVPVTAVSAFMNNAPVVAMMIPMIRSWTEKYNLSLSKYLIPLSYAAILGGMCTLIGTSTNLVIHGLLIDHGMEGLGLFEISKIGVPIAIVGLLYLVVVGNKILPDRKEPLVEFGENTREFVIELKVNKNYPNIGKSIEDAGLRHLTGLFLFQIERDKNIIAPASPTEIIKLGDRLFFTGIPKTILELQKTPGLQLIKDQTFDLKQYDAAEIRTYEAAISASSPLVGKNVRESNFRDKYHAVVIAIHRNGERIKRKIGDITLQPGDTLLLLAPKTFRTTWYHSKDFYLISDAVAIPSKPKWQVFFSIGILVSVILMTVLKVLPLIAAAGLGSVALIVSRTLTPSEASNVIDFRVLIIIASAFGIAEAMENSGLAAAISQVILGIGGKFGMIGIITAIYLTTSLYNNVITSTAAAAFLFPVAYATAQLMQIDVRPLAITVLFAAVASFATPISYQTNLMVYGPGGYKFKDFIKIGLPLELLVAVIAISLIHFYYFT